jgi:hypothetical protein
VPAETITLDQLPQKYLKTKQLLETEYTSVVNNLKIDLAAYNDYTQRNKLKEKGEYIDLSMLQYRPSVEDVAMDQWLAKVTNEDKEFWQLKKLQAMQIMLESFNPAPSLTEQGKKRQYPLLEVTNMIRVLDKTQAKEYLKIHASLLAMDKTGNLIPHSVIIGQHLEPVFHYLWK